MKRNMGALDRAIRIVIAAVIAVLSFTGVIRGTLNTVLVVVAIILLVTSLLSFCPLYVPFRIATNKKKSA